MAADGVGDTQEEVNPTQSEDNPTQLEDIPEELGSAANLEGQRRSHRIVQEYHKGQIHLSYRGNPYFLSP